MVIMGNDKARRYLLEEFTNDPPTLYNIPVEVKPQWTYLGEEIGRNVSDCVTLTINKRIGLAKKSIF